MAKRKRLSPADPVSTPLSPPASAPETKMQFPTYPNGVATHAPRRAPVADMAGAAATQAALDELTDAMQAARREGRLIQTVPLEAIAESHLVRDRMALDEAEMAALVASIRARGQQTPVELVALDGGRFGLLSGWRRLAALRQLQAETGEDRFATVNAIVRAPEGASEAYLAMVEENEIRADLSFYERARIAAEAARIGVFAGAAEAVKALFANAPAPKRSKILSFVTLYDALGEDLRFGQAIPEHLGLAVVAALRGDAKLAGRLKAALRHTPPADAAAERAILEGALHKAPAPKPPAEEIAPGLTLRSSAGQLVLKGKAVTPDLVRDLRAWLASKTP